MTHPAHRHRKEMPRWARDYSAPAREEREVNRTHDVPYLAGSSRNGDMTYIDRRVPRSLEIGHRPFDPAKPLAVHEQTEHDLMTKGGLKYYPAHHEAERAELRWFLKNGYTKQNFKEYDHAMTVIAEKVTEPEAIKNPPSDLYLKPYSTRRAKAIRMAEKGKSNAPPRSGT